MTVRNIDLFPLILTSQLQLIYREVWIFPAFPIHLQPNSVLSKVNYT